MATYTCTHCNEENEIKLDYIPDDDYIIHTCKECGKENKITFLVEKNDDDREDFMRDTILERGML